MVYYTSMKSTSNGGLRKVNKKPTKTLDTKVRNYLYNQRIQSPLSMQILYFAVIIYILFFACMRIASSFESKTIAKVKQEEVPPISSIKEVLEIKQECIDTRKYECLIKKYFGDEWKIAWAVMMAESSGNPSAHSTNCHYINEQGKRYSTFCKKGDEHKAFSSDSGLMAINSLHGLNRPYDEESNIAFAKQLRDRDGWNAWVSYKKNRHLKYLK